MITLMSVEEWSSSRTTYNNTSAVRERILTDENANLLSDNKDHCCNCTIQ